MFRLVLFVGVLAGVLANRQAAFADPVTAAAPDHARAAAVATEKASPATAASPPPAAPEPASAVGSDDIIPVGSGWG